MVYVEFSKSRIATFDTWSESFPDIETAVDVAAIVVEDGDADEATVNDATYRKGEGWDEGFADCIACDGYVLNASEAPYCPTCARERKD